MADVVCNCADIPPTMPTCRTEHLVDCPVYLWTRLQDREAMDAAHAELAEMHRNGDEDGIVAFLQRSSPDRGHAAWLRSRAARGER